MNDFIYLLYIYFFTVKFYNVNSRNVSAKIYIFLSGVLLFGYFGWLVLMCVWQYYIIIF